MTNRKHKFGFYVSEHWRTNTKSRNFFFKSLYFENSLLQISFYFHFLSFFYLFFVRQCLRKNLTEIHLNPVINYLTRKLRRKWTIKVNVECDTEENFKDDQGFLSLCSASSWEPNYFLNMYFFINTNLNHINFLYKRLQSKKTVYLRFSNF
jgi:hypothetical protein